MKIPLLVTDSALILSARVNAPHLTGIVDFILDTGSQSSMIGGISSRKLGITFNTINLKDELWWGDFKFRIGKLSNVSIWIKSEHNELKTLNLPYMNVSPDFIKTKDGIQSPNIIGLDFLRINKTKLVFDGVENESYLEIE